MKAGNPNTSDSPPPLSERTSTGATVLPESDDSAEWWESPWVLATAALVLFVFIGLLLLFLLAVGSNGFFGDRSETSGAGVVSSEDTGAAGNSETDTGSQHSAGTVPQETLAEANPDEQTASAPAEVLPAESTSEEHAAPADAQVTDRESPDAPPAARNRGKAFVLAPLREPYGFADVTDRLGGQDQHSTFSHRSGEGKVALLKRYGGTEETELSVSEGLDWLIRNQETDGFWNLDGPYDDGATPNNQIAATSLAVLCLLGAGNSTQSGMYQDNVTRGIRWLRKATDQHRSRWPEPGGFQLLVGEQSASYTHALATLALCEAYAMTGDRELRSTAAALVQICLHSQAPQGGWRYRPKSGSDTSVTGWFTLAILSGRLAGLVSEDEFSGSMKEVVRYLHSVRGADEFRYGYTSSQDLSRSMTAEGMLMAQITGESRRSIAQAKGSDYLNEQPVSRRHNLPYYYYYASQALHHYGGNAWSQWNAAMSVELPAMQQRDGQEKGSWDPGGAPHAARGGRLYVTCLMILSLEVYYRHLPVYRRVDNSSDREARE